MPRPLLAALLLLLALPAAARAQDNEIPIAPPDPPPPSAAPSRPPPVRLRPVTVAFRANAPGVRVHYLPDPVLEDTPAGGVRVRRAAPPRYSLLCEAPCDVELPQSHFGLAFSRGEDGRLIRSIEPFGVDGRTGVRVRWDDRAGERLAGLLTLAIGA
ncbi:MAG TPA: hypothetical protein RMH99_20665, partial [Sandaracinaceae bacterium LLY-WYZ-13_1]|nr:hypothetical protein [Sandaracinaceae bacterium LLY-WYZ-13_1]